MISPIKIFGEMIGWKNRSLVGIGRESESAPESEKGLPKLGRSEVGEPSDAVVGRGVEPLVALGAAEVGLEDLEPVVVLLLGRVSFTEPGLEEREMVLRSEPDLTVFVHHLPDQKIVAVWSAGERFRRSVYGGNEEERENNKERVTLRHF